MRSACEVSEPVATSWYIFHGLGAAMQDVVDLAGVNLRAASQPVAAVRLSGNLDVGVNSVLELVVAALRFRETEPSQLQPRVNEVAGLLRVGKHLFVGGDGFVAVTFVLEQIGDLEGEEVE